MCLYSSSIGWLVNWAAFFKRIPPVPYPEKCRPDVKSGIWGLKAHIRSIAISELGIDGAAEFLEALHAVGPAVAIDLRGNRIDTTHGAGKALGCFPGVRLNFQQPRPARSPTVCDDPAKAVDGGRGSDLERWKVTRE